MPDVTPDPRPVKTAKPRKTDRPASAAWYEAVMRIRPVWSDTDDMESLSEYGWAGEWEGHHLIPRKVCRKHNAPEWDHRNGVKASRRRHTRHHAGTEPILLYHLDMATQNGVTAFAAEHGLEAWVERYLQ